MAVQLASNIISKENDMSDLRGFFAEGKCVMITGCSSGIGRQTAVTLAKRGFTVFATVRKETDAQRLRDLGLHNLVPVCPVDLSNLDDISRALGAVVSELNRRSMKGLYALINNAGGGKPAPVELMDLENFHVELQTRLVGSVAMVQTFLPLIRKSRGRILWIMTPAIIPTPYVASIHSCDFAVNCMARTLNIELKRWGVRNIMIKCGGIKTPAGLRTAADVEAVLKSMPAERISLYERAFRKWGEDMAEFDKKRTEAERVAEIILKALFAKKPRSHYSVGYMARAAGFLEVLPQSLTDWILKKRF